MEKRLSIFSSDHSPPPTRLPWGLIGVGVAIGLVASMFKIPVLAFAVGVYLPLSTMGAVFLGGLMRYLLTKNQTPEVAEQRRERGVLFGSGLVGGGGLTGVILAMWVGIRGGERIEGFPPAVAHWVEMVFAAATILLILGCVTYVATQRQSSKF